MFPKTLAFFKVFFLKIGLKGNMEKILQNLHIYKTAYLTFINYLNYLACYPTLWHIK